ncbi:MAG TPA: GTPase Era [Lentisphaeria bacterium]|nr:GTPase Era [Lentisphaerota bacterium]OQC15633.1 MAG: GTPase Era [Lentisphaerae bacterium ADurb.Bin082]HPY89267.1 GTPase Era [Lentisphaeria bacterium]HQC52880.1 GTPase Era [Lentisphaeria bacterium]HQL86123.1 GTPase Era [Lentisphaeria bacterium]
MTAATSSNSRDQRRFGRTGYVALLGRPNTGKSTLLNTVLGQRLAAVSSKPQTTRKRLLGIHTDKDAQIIFLDAPGVHVGKLELDKAMDKAIARALEDADLLVVMLDPTREPGAEDELTAGLAAGCGKPAILAVNKTDVASAADIARSLAFYRQRLPDAPFLEIVALDRVRSEALLEQVKAMLPEGPFLYGDDDITNTSERDIAAELIREALLEELRQEVPHSVAVAVDSWKKKGNRLRLDATLYIERENHKAIIIGRGGQKIARIRESAEQRLQAFTGAPITLCLFVKVAPDWRQKKKLLQEFKLLE